MVNSLLRPDFYPHKPASVELIQTHISWVFLAGDRVYKIKKPVDFGFLDFSTLRKRGSACSEEVRLNRRLAGDMYLGTAPVYRRGEAFSLSPPGRIVEHAVVMKRLPADRLLSVMLSDGRATSADIRMVARRIAKFHAGAEPAMPGLCGLPVLRRNLLQNFQQTLPYLGRTVRERDYLSVWDYTRDFLARRRTLLEKRIRDGRLRDGHGDLHAEHVCLDRPVRIFDCVEFSPAIRQGDVAADIAFLYMDLLYHRHPVFARELMEEYLRRTGDWELRLLVPFYACYRAVVREKVESFRLADPCIGPRQKNAAARRAARYFTLARELAEADARPRLFIVGGLPGSGKSTVAAALAERTGADYLNSDVVRKGLAGVRPETVMAATFGEGIYSRSMTVLTYGEMFVHAERSIRAGSSVVLDATFSRETWRRKARGLARRTGASAVVVECHCPAGVARSRLLDRKERGGISDAGWEVYKKMRGRYEPPPHGTVRVDTTRSTEEGLAAIAAAAHPFRAS